MSFDVYLFIGDNLVMEAQKVCLRKEAKAVADFLPAKFRKWVVVTDEYELEAKNFKMKCMPHDLDKEFLEQWRDRLEYYFDSDEYLYSIGA